MPKRVSLTGLTSLSNNLTSMLSRVDISTTSSCTPMRGKELRSGCGNWLSHLDWEGER